jgi:hypothetical protein
MPHLPSTLEALDRTLDLRVPLTFDDEDCRLIGAVIAQVMAEFMAH